MKNIILIIVLVAFNIQGYSQVSNEKIVKLLKHDINKFNKNLNDTFRYDFKICPELIAWTKWDFVFNIDFDNPRLTRNLKKEGITDYRLIKFLRIITFHRILNKKNIDLNNQLKLFDLYKDLIIYEKPYEFWKQTNDTLYINIYRQYLSLFQKNIAVSGLLETRNTKHTWVYNGIEYKGKVVNTIDKNIMVEVIWIDHPLDGYKLTKDIQVKDTILVDPIEVDILPK